jgi:trans-aconitate 2-methyltransferase
MKQTQSDHWNADGYSKNSTMQFTAFMNLLSDYPFRSNENVLDIGCGDGKITYEIAKNLSNGTVTGIDSSQSMIDYAIANYSQNNLFFETYNAELLFAYNKKFDTIVSSFCLQWITNKFAVFEGIKKCLNINGRFIILLPIKNPTTAKIRKEMLKKEKWRALFQNYVDPTLSADDLMYHEYIKNAGLKLEKYTEEKVITTFKDKHSLKKFIAAITAHLSHLPTEALREEFMSELMDNYMREIPSNKLNECFIHYTYISIVGTNSN